MKLTKKYLSDIMKVTLLQVTLLDGLKAVLENIKKNHSEVGQKLNYLRLSIRLNPKTFCFSFFIFSFKHLEYVSAFIFLLLYFDLELVAFGFYFPVFIF